MKRLLILVSLLVLAGCGESPYDKGEREFTDSIRLGEPEQVILSQYPSHEIYRRERNALLLRSYKMTESKGIDGYMVVTFVKVGE